MSVARPPVYRHFLSDMSAEEVAKSIASAKKWRGVAKGSVTRLSGRISDLEAREDAPNASLQAKQMLKSLESLTAEFRTHHLALIELVDDEDVLRDEQDVIDSHDDIVGDLVTRLNVIISTRSPDARADPQRVVSKRLAHLEKGLNSVCDEIAAMPADSRDDCLIRQREEQLLETKRELGNISRDLLSLDLDDDHALMTLQSTLESKIFDNLLALKRKLSSLQPTAVPVAGGASDGKGVRLPKIDVPTFDGSILHWKSFWEQFSVAVHNRRDISDTEKLVYLRHSVKDGSAKNVIEGLSRTGEHYNEAIECLQTRFDRPRLIHQAHVRKVLDIPNLKDGSGKELRRLHDVAQQHLRALKSMGKEPSGAFITSTLELKLDPGTLFEWQKHSQDETDVPHYRDFLDFVNLRAQASEGSAGEVPKRGTAKTFSGFGGGGGSDPCVICKGNKHPLYSCSKFKTMTHEQKLAAVKGNKLCLNCLKPGHFVKACKSLHRCRDCQKPHHSLLHSDGESNSGDNMSTQSTTDVPSHAAATVSANSLLMTCQIMVVSADGSSRKARALLDSGSSASFVSDRLARSLNLPCSRQSTRLFGIAGLRHGSSSHFVTKFRVTSRLDPKKSFDVSAIIIPRVTCDLPAHSISVDRTWHHLEGLQLADPDFGHSRTVDVLLGVDVFVESLLHGRQVGPPGCPIALETEFGWVLAGTVDKHPPSEYLSCHVSLLTGDELLRSFWEIEEAPQEDPVMSAEERAVVHHFEINHYRKPDGRFVVPLPKKMDGKELGETRSQAVRRFLNMERSLHSKKQFPEIATVMEEYFALGHAEQVPFADLQKSPQDVFYLPMHSVHKASSTTTKIRLVFDASAKSTTNVSLNDTLMIGPNVHPPLLDVLLRFRLHEVALTADVSKMYRAVELAEDDKDHHRFVWRNRLDEPLVDYRMKRVTFGVSASSFAANMAVKQNAADFAHIYPRAAEVTAKSIYVDDCLTGAATVDEAVSLQVELQALFNEARFLLRKWNSSEPATLNHLPSDLKESHFSQMISEPEYTKTLGIEWNSKTDVFRLTINKPPKADLLTKPLLTSDIAKTFDVLGWFSPSTIKAKILLQKLWEQKVDWDDAVPQTVLEVWQRWRSELTLLSNKTLPRCYFPKRSVIQSLQLHGFCDASEDAFAAVIYLRVVSESESVHTSLVLSKTRVAPFKRLTIPRLELCGAHLLSRILAHVREILEMPLHQVFAWTDSTVVLSWLTGDPRRFKTYVGNRVSRIVELLPPDRWQHVSGTDNPADCASRGLFPSELLEHPLWWTGPPWLTQDPTLWPQVTHTNINRDNETETRKTCLVSIVTPNELIPLTRYSSYTRLKRVTAWILRFVHNCRVKSTGSRLHGPLSVSELDVAGNLWVRYAQLQDFHEDIECLRGSQGVPSDSPLLPLHPILDSSEVIRVGGRVQNSAFAYSQRHPIILHGRHQLTKLIISTEHIRLLHGGPTLIISSLSRRFHIVGQKKAVRTITRSCMTCRRTSVRPHPQLMGQLPFERASPGMVFEQVGLDFAGPLYIKLGRVRKPVIVKAYVCVFVALSVKAVHLEAVSDLSSDAFLACLRRFMGRRGIPSTIWSDHGSNFIGAKREISELKQFFSDQQISGEISEFCSTQNIEWKFIPEQAPHFGGLWESAVRSMKTHLRRIVGDVKLTFEELSMVLAQIESCLNSRPLIPDPNEDGIEPLTPGHFLIGRPLKSLPDPPSSYQSMSLLRRWNLCQTLTRHFWKRWSGDYFASLRKFSKWHSPTRNAKVGDVVLLKEDGLVPTKWPMAKIVSVHPGKDKIVRVVTVKTAAGTYTRPVTKTALLLPPGLT